MVATQIIVVTKENDGHKLKKGEICKTVGTVGSFTEVYSIKYRKYELLFPREYKILSKGD